MARMTYWTAWGIVWQYDLANALTRILVRIESLLCTLSGYNAKLAFNNLSKWRPVIPGHKFPVPCFCGFCGHFGPWSKKKKERKK